jgi:two-component system, chemotaxis family, protein-glutamate methylesterase/glutaminase
MADNHQEPKFIIAIGASAGGLNSVIELLSQISPDLDAAVFVVLHLRKLTSDGALLQRLQSNASFPCKLAEHNESIKRGHIYIGVPDEHLIVKKGTILLGHGPQENLWRPSIDVLFRSVAASYDSRSIGIILSGLMYDGTSGMIAIKRCGGTCIVQDPAEAEYPDMIRSVLQNVEVDFCVPLESMGDILVEKTKNGINRHEIPADVKAEAEIAERMAIGIDNLKEIGEKSIFICPDCGGGLWEMVNDNVVRYRCHTGHVYNQKELLIRQSDALENTLWTALRMMEERKNLLDKMAGEEKRKGWKSTAQNKEERARDLNTHIERLKEILYESKHGDPSLADVQNSNHEDANS